MIRDISSICNVFNSIIRSSITENQSWSSSIKSYSFQAQFLFVTLIRFSQRWSKTNDLTSSWSEKILFHSLSRSNSTFICNLYNSHLEWNTRAHSLFRETHQWQDKIESRSSIRTMLMSVYVCFFTSHHCRIRRVHSFFFFFFFFPLSLHSLRHHVH